MKDKEIIPPPTIAEYEGKWRNQCPINIDRQGLLEFLPQYIKGFEFRVLYALFSDLGNQVKNLEARLKLPHLGDVHHLPGSALSDIERQTTTRYEVLKRYYSTFIKLITLKYKYLTKWDVFKSQQCPLDCDSKTFLGTPYKALRINLAICQLINHNGVPFSLGASFEQMTQEYTTYLNDKGLTINPAKIIESNEDEIRFINQERSSWAKNPILSLSVTGGRMRGHKFSPETNLKFGFEIGYYFDPNEKIDIGLGIVPILEFQKVQSHLFIKGDPVALDGHMDYQELIAWADLQFPQRCRKSIFEF